jgi:uroporphyrinogen decarboxylase
MTINDSQKTSSSKPAASSAEERLHNSRLMRAARCEPTDTTPVWIMRQAGRYLPEYMEVRSKVTFIELCKRPELAAEVTLTAQRVLGVDAAILFADLLPMLEPMGIDLEYAKGEGPVIHNPIRTAGEVDRIRELEDVNSMSFVFDAVRLIRRDLPGDIPLLGFAGAPFTLASYMIEGGGSKNYVDTKSLMYSDRGAWAILMERLARSLIRYLNAQIDAGCQAVQLFDSWAGCLSPSDYRRYVLPFTKQVIDGVRPGVPVINFLTGNPSLLPMLREAGGHVIGLDWRVDLADAWKTVGYDVGVQGNLDPVSLMADLPVLKERAKAVLDAAANRPGHIFNLGHGVFPEVPPESVKALVQMVHEMGQR